MSEENKQTEPDKAEKPAWRVFIGKWKVAITAVVGIVLGVLAGDQGIVEGITAIVKAIFGGQ